MKTYFIFSIILIVCCYGSVKYFGAIEHTSGAIISDHYSYIDEINKLQMKKLDPGLEPLEGITDTNKDKGRRSPEFKGMSAVAGISDQRRVDELQPVGALTDKKSDLTGSVVSVAARSLYYQEGDYRCNSHFLAQYVIWIKGVPVMAAYAPCVTRTTEVYWHEDIRPSDIRIEYTNDRTSAKESNDLLIQAVLLNDQPLHKSTTNSSWSLNQCKSMASLPDGDTDLIMHCNGMLTFRDTPLVVSR